MFCATGLPQTHTAVSQNCSSSHALISLTNIPTHTLISLTIIPTHTYFSCNYSHSHTYFSYNYSHSHLFLLQLFSLTHLFLLQLFPLSHLFLLQLFPITHFSSPQYHYSHNTTSHNTIIVCHNTQHKVIFSTSKSPPPQNTFCIEDFTKSQVTQFVSCCKSRAGFMELLVMFTIGSWPLHFWHLQHLNWF